jgi:hypothetical protein
MRVNILRRPWELIRYSLGGVHHSGGRFAIQETNWRILTTAGTEASGKEKTDESE